jgi:hypothetical protein
LNVDKITLDLAVEATPHVEIRRLRAERKRLEALPRPDKSPADLTGLVSEMEASLKARIAEGARSVVHKAAQNCEASFSAGALKEQTVKVFHDNLSNEIEAVVLLQYLPYLRKSMEEAMLRKSIDGYDNRFRDVDAGIRRWGEKIYVPFDPELINDPGVKYPQGGKRFPYTRCRELSGRFFDSWLTDALKSKPIFFDSPDYVDRLIEFFEKIYTPLHDAELKEREAEKAKAEIKPEPPPVGKVAPNDFSKSDEFGTVLGQGDESFANRHPRVGGGRL